MMQLPEDFDSIFRYIVVVSQRAEQLINGAKPRAESRHLKPTLMARDDVDAGTVTWRILTQEELDAQRQAIVDQFRAEVGTDEAMESAAPIPDVLPTRQAVQPEAADAEGGERDDEIARLQRLLGMAGGRGAAAESGDEDDDESDEKSAGSEPGFDDNEAGFDDDDVALDLDEDDGDDEDDGYDSDSDGDDDD